MAGSEQSEVTGLLKAWSGGEQSALDRLAPLVYQELHRMARRYMRNERAGATLQATALVNARFEPLTPAHADRPAFAAIQRWRDFFRRPISKVGKLTRRSQVF